MHIFQIKILILINPAMWHKTCRQIKLIYSLTYLLIPWSRVFLEKLPDSQLVKKFPTFYGT